VSRSENKGKRNGELQGTKRRKGKETAESKMVDEVIRVKKKAN